MSCEPINKFRYLNVHFESSGIYVTLRVTIGAFYSYVRCLPMELSLFMSALEAVRPHSPNSPRWAGLRDRCRATKKDRVLLVG